MKKQLLLTIAMSASLASFGALAADTSNDQSSNRGAASSGGGVSGDGVTAHVSGMTFDELDKNKDGKLSWAEANMEPTLTEQFPQLDKNGDGVITRSEFNAAMGAAPSGGASTGQTPSSSSSSDQK